MMYELHPLLFAIVELKRNSMAIALHYIIVSNCELG